MASSEYTPNYDEYTKVFFFTAKTPRFYNHRAASRWRWRCCDQQAVGRRPVFRLPRALGGQVPLTFLHHADAQALLEATVLAAVASPLVHGAVFTGQTHVLGVFLHRALRRERTNNQPPNTINHLIFDRFNLISGFFFLSLSLSFPQ